MILTQPSFPCLQGQWPNDRPIPDYVSSCQGGNAVSDSVFIVVCNLTGRMVLKQKPLIGLSGALCRGAAIHRYSLTSGFLRHFGFKAANRARSSSKSGRGSTWGSVHTALPTLHKPYRPGG